MQLVSVVGSMLEVFGRSFRIGEMTSSLLHEEIDQFIQRSCRNLFRRKELGQNRLRGGAEGIA